jgi:aspartate aminotransferase
MPNAGYQNTRKVVAETASREQEVRIEEDHIVMTCGAAGGLNTVLKTILNPGDQVIVPKPYFVEYGYYISNNNGEMVNVQTNADFSLNTDNIESLINEKTRAVLINSPNNPTGKVYSENDIRVLSSVLDRYSETYHRPIYLLSDEAYRKIVYDDIRVPSVSGVPLLFFGYFLPIEDKLSITERKPKNQSATPLIALSLSPAAPENRSSNDKGNCSVAIGGIKRPRSA